MKEKCLIKSRNLKLIFLVSNTHIVIFLFGPLQIGGCYQSLIIRDKYVTKLNLYKYNHT